jgi:diaminohydroxyphosphoribosylaminopyrimidine deaminase / 5-amino-6-(5-phosphoribosylamino)uracil reductase
MSERASASGAGGGDEVPPRVLVDAEFMQRALFLAERGRGRTTPNPLVGAVVVSPDGIIVGQGAHMRAGGPHAEVVALQAAGPQARGATLYCTLEPCTHTGRTGPCVERIVEAGVTRVVTAVRDPNPLVSGAGTTYLRAHGVEVVEGLGEAEATRLNGPFFSWVTHRRPFVTLKAATSADGFMGRHGARVQLTGSVADRFFHRQRAEVDAIAVGSGTVLSDDPQLTARHVYRARPLIRVIFDWRMRVPASARVFSTTAAGPVIMMVSRHEAEARPDAAADLERAGATIARFETRDLGPMLEDLAGRDILWLLVEGGPTLHAAFLEAGFVDHVQWAMTTRVLEDGVPLAAGQGRDLVWGMPPRVTPLGDDVLVEFDVYRSD